MGNMEIVRDAERSASTRKAREPAPLRLEIHPPLDVLSRLAETMRRSGEAFHASFLQANQHVLLTDRADRVRRLHEQWPPVEAFSEMISTVSVQPKPKRSASA